MSEESKKFCDFTTARLEAPEIASVIRHYIRDGNTFDARNDTVVIPRNLLRTVSTLIDMLARLEDWHHFSDATPRDRVLLGCWESVQGTLYPVLVQFDESNKDSNGGFISLNGWRMREGSLIGWYDFLLPNNQPALSHRGSI